MTPSNAAYATLADQDDRWHPEKLETLLAPSVTPTSSTATLGSSIAKDDCSPKRTGRGVATTTPTWRRSWSRTPSPVPLRCSAASCSSWRCRSHHATARPTTTTGWPLVALASGRIAYVDRPLYDYVQHRGAALGHARANAGRQPHSGAGTAAEARCASPARRWRPGDGIYFWDVCRLLQFATVLERRCGGRMSARKRRAVRRLADSERSPRAMAWLWLRRARELAGRNETLGAEGALLRGIAWRHAVALVARRELPPGRLGGNASVPPRPTESGTLPVTRHLGTLDAVREVRSRSSSTSAPTRHGGSTCSCPPSTSSTSSAATSRSSTWRAGLPIAVFGSAWSPSIPLRRCHGRGSARSSPTAASPGSSTGWRSRSRARRVRSK